MMIKMKAKTPRSKYEEAVHVADTITKEMSWIYASREILDKSGSQEIVDRFSNTYAGHTWNVVRRSLLNGILMSICKILIDDDHRVSSFHTLNSLLQDEEVLEIVKNEYSQSKEAFDSRLNQLVLGLSGLDSYLKENKKLVRHRNHYLVHRAREPYKGPDTLQWGDEKDIIKKLEEVVEPMEHLLLGNGNVSHSTVSTYKLYAKDFWESFTPNSANLFNQ